MLICRPTSPPSQSNPQQQNGQKCGVPANPVQVLYLSTPPVEIIQVRMCNPSPAKVLRNVKRMTNFIEKKSFQQPKNKSQQITDVHKSLLITPHKSISFSPPRPRLVSSLLSSIDIPPIIKKKPKLQIVKIQSTSISPRPVYHPAIVNACDAMFAKHPSKLNPDEVQKFKLYQNHKTKIGEPLETEVIYLPIGGLRTCLNCRELT
jgi:hypothetical protein